MRSFFLKMRNSEFVIDTLRQDELQWFHTYQGGSHVQEEGTDRHHSPPHALGG